ncbi:MAG: hypothetical protein QHC79_09545 [Pseudosphingobacterium sp.]|uniref:Uncharacterized protein n=1 Tax=Sphingobacterium sp. (strain 21) TaxID=743722 RepID=F4C2C8_SPHS2|nr:hypothetical protein [Pseudosphingobacterium sp.]
MAENTQEKELKTFGFTGKLRTGLVTAIMALMLTAIVFLTQYAISLNKEILQMQGNLYNQMIKEIKTNVKTEVKETVVPTVKNLDTVASKLDSATTELKQKIQNVR